MSQLFRYFLRILRRLLIYGVQGTASEATLVSLLAARSKTIKQHVEQNPQEADTLLSRLVAYTSDQVFICVYIM
jgi:Pyridoxal-dependent decarboxylase conserved domain